MPPSTVQVNVDTSEASLAKVSLSIPPEEFEQEYKGALRKVSRNVTMKGFRPGKVPPALIEKRMGEQVQKDVMEEFVRRAYKQALDENDLSPLSHPRVPNEAMTRGEDGGFSLDFEISLKPKFELPEYKNQVIESELEPVLPEQVEATIEQLRRERATPEPVGDEGLGEQGMAVCDVAFLYEGEPVLERTGLRLGIHTPPPGVDPQAFEEALSGCRDEEVRECPVTLPEYIETEEARGKEGICRITVNEAYDLVPPSDEELWALLEVSDAEALETRIKEKLEEAAEKRERDRIEAALLDRLIEETDLALPAPMLEEQTEIRLRNLAEEMVRQGVPPETIKDQLEEQRETAREDAEKGMRALLIVEALGEKEGLLVTEDEINAELENIASRNETSVEEVRKYYVENGLIQQMSIELLERKVRRFLYDQAEIKEPS